MGLQTTLVLVVITLMTAEGDYFIKMATMHPRGMQSAAFVAGSLLYGLPGFGWFLLMRTHSLAMVAVFYAVATLLMLVALGVLVFREPFGWREFLGVALAIAAVLVMTRE